MVRTSQELPITERITNFFVMLWGLIYLFFASIFSSPKANNADSQNQARFGGGKFKGSSGNMRGLAKGGGGPRMGG